MIGKENPTSTCLSKITDLRPAQFRLGFPNGLIKTPARPDTSEGDEFGRETIRRSTIYPESQFDFRDVLPGFRRERFAGMDGGDQSSIRLAGGVDGGRLDAADGWAGLDGDGRGTDREERH